MRKIVIDVAVSHVEDAVRFYCQVFNGSPLEADAPGERALLLGRMVLRVVDRAGYVPDEKDRFYREGRSTRLELRVDDVAAWTERAIAAGATLRGRIPALHEGGLLRYAQILDPFGHIFAFAEAFPMDQQRQRRSRQG